MITKKELIVKNNDNFKSCHASNVCYLSNGTIMVVWFAGSKEGAADISIWGAIRKDETWSEPKIIANENEVAHWNPVLFQKDNKELVLFYKVGDTIATWKTMVKYSNDCGETWSNERELVPGDVGGRGPVRNKVIQLSNGRILAAASSEDSTWRSFADISDDNGFTWKKSNDIYANLNENRETSKNMHEIPVSEQSYIGRGVIQPTIWGDDKGVHMLMRSSEGYLYRSDSIDNGEVFCPAYKTNIPNNNSGIDVIRHNDNNLYLVYNPVGINWGKRSPLCLACSKDNGVTFTDILVLEDGEGEFSYPSIISVEGVLYLTYTFDRKNIAFWRIDL